MIYHIDGIVNTDSSVDRSGNDCQITRIETVIEFVFHKKDESGIKINIVVLHFLIWVPSGAV